jgi:hypothetical protein
LTRVSSYRVPGNAADRGPAISGDSRSNVATTQARSGSYRKKYKVQRHRGSSAVDCDVDSSTDSESEASVTRWKLTGPSVGHSAADSGYSSGQQLHSQAYADSATSQRYVLPRFTISTRTRPAEAASAYPLLQPLPLRPHTSQFHPSRAMSASNFPASSSGTHPQAWSSVGLPGDDRAAPGGGPVQASRERAQEGMDLPEGEPLVYGSARGSLRWRYPGPAAQHHNMLPPGLHHDEEEDEEHDEGLDGVANVYRGMHCWDTPLRQTSLCSRLFLF